MVELFTPSIAIVTHLKKLHHFSHLALETSLQCNQSILLAIPSDGFLISRWCCSWEFLGTPWSKESDAQPPERDYMKFVVYELNC